MNRFIAVALFVLGVAGYCQGSPAEARIREQFDKEHEEGVDRVRLKYKEAQAGETGNKDRQYQAQVTDTELRLRPGSGSRSRGYGRDDVEAEQGGDAMTYSGRGRARAGKDDETDYNSHRRGYTSDALARQKDARAYEKNHEDVARYAQVDDIDYAKDSYRKKDKSSHKKEEIYLTK